MHLNDFFGALWNDYVAMAPQAAALKAAFERRCGSGQCHRGFPGMVREGGLLKELQRCIQRSQQERAGSGTWLECCQMFFEGKQDFLSMPLL